MTNQQHHRACSEAGGSDPTARVKDEARRERDAGFADDVRWPGYLGNDYRPGGVLWVSNIHRNFDSSHLPASFATEANDCIRAWRDGLDSDEEFLARLRAIYTVGLATWTVGRWASNALTALGVPLSAIAYGNAARCQAADTGTVLQKLCLGRWSVRDLVADLKPGLVLLTSKTALTLSGPQPWPCDVVAFSQRNGLLMNTSPWQPPGMGEERSQSAWLPQLTATWPRHTRPG